MTEEKKAIHCVGCEGGIEALSEDVIVERIKQWDGWEYQADKKRLSKLVQFKGFMKTMSFVNAVAWMANREQHHPDLEVTYNTCRVNYQTHAVEGITENDFICVEKVEELLA